MILLYLNLNRSIGSGQIISLITSPESPNEPICHVNSKPVGVIGYISNSIEDYNDGKMLLRRFRSRNLQRLYK